MIKIPYAKHDDFMRVGNGYSPAKTLTVNYYDIAEVSISDYHMLSRKDQETAVIRNAYVKGNKFVEFEEWYKAWDRESAPRFYIDPLHCLRGYNKYVTTGQGSIPKGLRMLSHSEGMDASSNMYLSYKGIVVRNPYNFYAIGCDPFEPVDLPLTPEEKLRKKFSWLKTKLSFEDLKELDVWWEDMIYKETEDSV